VSWLTSRNGWPDFTIMRQLAIRFRGLLQNGDLERFAAWLDDVQQSGIYGMQRFARRCGATLTPSEMP